MRLPPGEGECNFQVFHPRTLVFPGLPGPDPGHFFHGEKVTHSA